MSKLSGKDRRRQPRIQVSLPVSVFTGSPASESIGTVFNVSESGAFLRTARAVELGQAIAVQFEPGVVEPARYTGRVARVDDLHGVGVEFTDDSQNLRGFVRKLLEVCRDIHRDAGDPE